jgi:hypothetical protein
MRDAPDGDRCGTAIDVQDRESFVSWRWGLAGRTYVHVGCLRPGDDEALLDARR